MSDAHAFANDPLNLVAASEAMNQEKSAYGPSEWLPPVPELQCGYIENWVGVLDAYDLGINAADKAAAGAVLAAADVERSCNSLGRECKSGCRDPRPRHPLDEARERQRQSTAIAAFVNVRMPTDQKRAGASEPVFRWRAMPMPSRAPMIEDRELDPELDVVQVVRDAPRRCEQQAGEPGDREAHVHEGRHLSRPLTSSTTHAPKRIAKPVR